MDIAKSVLFIHGGSDKGRDIIYQGITKFFGDEAVHHSYLFQVKHKSGKGGFSALKADLSTELKKVFIKNNLKFDHYCLVTNLPLSGSQFDELIIIFNEFFTKHTLSFRVQFNIYTYQHIESCIDRHDFLKWCFPSIINNTDFKYLLEHLADKKSINLSTGWLNVFEKNRERFVYTSKYEEALKKIHEKNIVLLSGPPKSGKSFSAEMIALSMVFNESFTVYKLDRVEDFDQIYDQNKKQLFLFDDAFGKHNIEFARSDAFDRKIEYILNLLDTDHKCIFTSREYIYKAFIGYSDSGLEDIIAKILVEVSDLSAGEKDSIFRRYFTLKFPTQSLLSDAFIETTVKHKNFSPETIRSYFDNTESFDTKEFIQHLNTPDAYLEKVFSNLTKEKRVVLLALLFATDGSDESVAYSFRHVCTDTTESILVNLKAELDLLVGSIIKQIDGWYDFYHPSMFDFFVRYLGKDLSSYRQLLFRNFNLELLSLSQFKVPTSASNAIEIKREDIDDLVLGTKRLINNPTISIYEINSLIAWMNLQDFLVNFRLKIPAKYFHYNDELINTIKTTDFSRFIDDNLIDIGIFFNAVRQLVTIKPGDSFFEPSALVSFLKSRQEEADYWRLVFSITPFLEEKIAIMIVTKNWLNAFYLSLKSDIDTLGNELFGHAYPQFELLETRNQLLEQKKFVEAAKIEQRSHADFKRNTNRSWYPRYKACKEKMDFLKSSKPIGAIIYDKLQPNFSLLKRLEDNQKNRYFFNTGKKWW